ncbi:hypothetical protein WCLP8_2750007 [uncultured Gammaproteobacteria bacterium]
MVALYMFAGPSTDVWRFRCRGFTASLFGTASGQCVGALVFGMAGVAPHPSKIDIVSETLRVQSLPQILVLNRAFGRCPPAVGFPAVNPLGDAVAQILAIGVQANLGLSAECFQRRNCRHQFHAVVGGRSLAAEQFLFNFAIAQNRPPAAWAGIAATGTVGKDIDRFVGGVGVGSSRLRSIVVHVVETPVTARMPSLLSSRLSSRLRP